MMRKPLKQPFGEEESILLRPFMMRKPLKQPFGEHARNHHKTTYGSPKSAKGERLISSPLGLKRDWRYDLATVLRMAKMGPLFFTLLSLKVRSIFLFKKARNIIGKWEILLRKGG